MKPGYKQTEVGVIPEDWELNQLGTLVEYTKGFAFKSGEYSSQGVRVVRVSDTSYDSILEENAVFVPSSKAHQCAKWRLQKDDLVISTVGSKPPMYDSMVGKVLLVPVEHEGALLNQNAVLIRDKKRRTHFQQILVSHLRTKRYLTWIESIYRGNANQASITLKELFAFLVCYPTGDAEQRDIAAALSNLDALHGALDRLIAKKRDLKQAAMQQLLTGQNRLPGFIEEWEATCLNKIVTRTAGFWGLENCDEGHQKHAEVIRAGDISPGGELTATAPRYFSDGEFAKAQCRLGDVVITGSGSVGKVWWCDGRSDVAASNFVRVLRPKGQRVNGLFLSQLLRSEATQRLMVEHIATGVMANLGATFFTTEWLNLPPLPEQTAIAAVLSDMDAELAALEQRRAKTRALKQGMMQELLTGRTRLVAGGAAKHAEMNP